MADESVEQEIKRIKKLSQGFRNNKDSLAAAMPAAIVMGIQTYTDIAIPPGMSELAIGMAAVAITKVKSTLE